MQPVSPDVGGSGYFSDPADHLDPRLFAGEQFRPDVRSWLLDTLYSFWAKIYHRPRDWSTVWVAGSGISYQWAADRSNGDLDILIGVDYDDFYTANPKFQGLSENDLADIFNRELHDGLWPQTAETSIHGGVFEVTYYVNPNSTDIRNIKPYAAYNLSANDWTVRPPHGTDFVHPKQYYDAAEGEVRQARSIIDQYNHLANDVKGKVPNSPGWHNALRQVELVTSQAAAMFDSIHLGRKQAFAPSGSGYGDYYNFRWQYHKKNGTVQALHNIAATRHEAISEAATSVYGAPIDGAELALRRAALWNRGGNGRN